MDTPEIFEISNEDLEAFETADLMSDSLMIVIGDTIIQETLNG
jgi:hypothetical protein